jgi:hypothetical protein
MRGQDETVLEMLKRGPLCRTMLPDIGNLRAVMSRLRKLGHRIGAESRTHYDGERLRRMHEYRLLPPRSE